MSYQWNKKHKLTYGISSKLYGIDPGDFEPKNSGSPLNPVHIERERGLESAAYIADSFKVNDRLLVDYGLRYSYFAALGESSQRIYQPNVPLNDATVTQIKTYKNNETIKSYGGLEPRIAARFFLPRTFRSRPVTTNLFNTSICCQAIPRNRLPTPGNCRMNVRPQSAQQFSLGLYKNLQDDIYEVSVEGYYKKSKNILDYKVGAELLLNENVERNCCKAKAKPMGLSYLLKNKSEGSMVGLATPIRVLCSNSTANSARRKSTTASTLPPILTSHMILAPC
jgi:hypothetical protein